MTDFAQLVLASDTRGLKDAQRELRNLTSAGDQTERNVTRATGMMDKGFRSVGIAAAKMAGALTGAFLSGRWLVGAIRDSEELERTMMRTQAIINATGGVAGRTAEQLRRQADELARATLADERQILRVQQQLLTFRNIRGEVFDDAIKAALDLSEAMGTDLSSAAMQVAKALENPVQGVTALTRSGTVFTQAQRDMIRSLVEAGNVAGAQALILAELEAQYGGAAEAAAQGLGGAVDGLGQSMRDMGRAMVENFGLMDATQAAVEALERGARFLGDNMEYVRIGALGAGAVVLGMYTPAIVTATGATLAWFASLITLRGALMATGLGALIVGAGIAIDFLFRLRSATGSWGEALEALGRVASGVWDGIVSSASAIPPALAAIWQAVKSDFFQALGDMAEAWAQFMQTIAQGAANIPILGQSISDGMQGAITDVVTAAADLAETSSMASTEASNLRNNAASMVREGFAPARRALADLNSIMSQNVDQTTEAADAARDLAASLSAVAGGGGGGGGGGAAGAASALNDLSDAADRASQMGRQLEQSFETAFVGIVTGSMKAREAIGRLLQDLARLMAQRAFQSLFGGAFSGGGGFFSGLFGGFRADGGPVSAGKSYIVGERGPELFTPGASGQITSNENMRGGGQLVIRLDLSQDVEARIMQNTSAQSVQIVRTETPRMIGSAFSRARENRAFD